MITEEMRRLVAEYRSLHEKTWAARIAMVTDEGTHLEFDRLIRECTLTGLRIANLVSQIEQEDSEIRP